MLKMSPVHLQMSGNFSSPLSKITLQYTGRLNHLCLSLRRPVFMCFSPWLSCLCHGYV
ncbi:hypothetical protein KP509_1Z158700 [Ceratopteris richardii]|nr:hypothetical protein KP509_1Z158700 [Ceratopteris richardii]